MAAASSGSPCKRCRWIAICLLMTIFAGYGHTSWMREAPARKSYRPFSRRCSYLTAVQHIPSIQSVQIHNVDKPAVLDPEHIAADAYSISDREDGIYRKQKLSRGSISPSILSAATSSLDLDIPVWRPDLFQSILVLFGIPALVFTGLRLFGDKDKPLEDSASQEPSESMSTPDILVKLYKDIEHDFQSPEALSRTGPDSFSGVKDSPAQKELLTPKDPGGASLDGSLPSSKSSVSQSGTKVADQEAAQALERAQAEAERQRKEIERAATQAKDDAEEKARQRRAEEEEEARRRSEAAERAKAEAENKRLEAEAERKRIEAEAELAKAREEEKKKQQAEAAARAEKETEERNQQQELKAVTEDSNNIDVQEVTQPSSKDGKGAKGSATVKQSEGTSPQVQDSGVASSNKGHRRRIGQAAAATKGQKQSKASSDGRKDGSSRRSPRTGNTSSMSQGESATIARPESMSDKRTGLSDKPRGGSKNRSLAAPEAELVKRPRAPKAGSAQAQDIHFPAGNAVSRRPVPASATERKELLEGLDLVMADLQKRADEKKARRGSRVADTPSTLPETPFPPPSARAAAQPGNPQEGKQVQTLLQGLTIPKLRALIEANQGVLPAPKAKKADYVRVATRTLDGKKDVQQIQKMIKEMS